MELLDKIDMYINEDDEVLLESIKTDIDDKLKPDSMERSGKVITLTWNKVMDLKDLKKKIEKALSKHIGKIKVYVMKKGKDSVAELELSMGGGGAKPAYNY